MIAAKSHASLEDEGLTCLGTFKEPGADKLEFTGNGTLAEHGWLMNWMSHEICGVGLENFRMAIHVQPVVNRLRGNGLRWYRTLSSPPQAGPWISDTTNTDQSSVPTAAHPNAAHPSDAANPHKSGPTILEEVQCLEATRSTYADRQFKHIMVKHELGSQASSEDGNVTHERQPQQHRALHHAGDRPRRSRRP